MYNLQYRPTNFSEFIGHETITKGLLTSFPKWPSTFLLIGQPGVGKAQPNDEVILTPDGWKPMGSIKVGDYVYGSEGKPVQVLGVFPQGEKDIYKVVFNDQTSTECSGEHLWYFYPEDSQICESCNSMHKFKIQNTLQIQEGLQNQSYKKNRYNAQGEYRIPIVKPIDFVYKNLLIDPYVLGILIGDGNLSSGGAGFSSKDDFIIKEMQTRLKMPITKYGECDYRIAWEKFIYTDIEQHTLDGKLVKIWPDMKAVCSSGAFKQGVIYDCLKGRQKTAYKYVWRSKKIERKRNNLTDNLKSIGIYKKHSYEKFIPKEYLISSIQQRTKLLQGLCDTDGYVSNQNSASFCTTSKQLSEDFMQLVRSLGGTARRTEGYPTYSYKGIKKTGRKAYNISFSFNNDIMPFLLPRKREKWRNHTFFKWKGIIKIELVRKAQCTCILVDSPNHLYVTRDYILTHNTTLARLIVKQLGCIDMNITELDAGQDRGIDKIREITRRAYEKPLVGSTKAFIVDEAQGLTAEAQQALLKVTEESPANTYFIFCSTDPKKIIRALRERCQLGEYSLNPLPEKDLGLILKHIIQKEEIKIDDNLREIARICIKEADGIPRKLVMLFEKFKDYQDIKEVENLSRYVEEVDEDLLPMISALDNLDKGAFFQAMLSYNKGNWESLRIVMGQIFKKKVMKAYASPYPAQAEKYHKVLNIFDKPVDNQLGDIEITSRMKEF